MSKTKKNIQHVLLPGTEVETSIGICVTVYPMGWKHMKKFSNMIMTAFGQAATYVSFDPDKLKNEAYMAEITQKLIGTIAPFAIMNMLDLVEACTKIPDEFAQEGFEVEDLPMEDVAKVVDAWVTETFDGEGKMKPWVQLIEKVARVVFKKEISISDMLSKLSLQQDTALEKLSE